MTDLKRLVRTVESWGFTRGNDADGIPEPKAYTLKQGTNPAANLIFLTLGEGNTFKDVLRFYFTADEKYHSHRAI